jgi:HAD superfamily hydrolase (TIGR01457 family)
LAQLHAITHLVIDMDGVLYRGNNPLPGLPEFFEFLRGRGIGFRLATNNSGSTPQQYAAKLRRMGADVAPGEIITSGTATARWLAGRLPPGARVHVFGEASLRTAVTEAGFELADEDVSAVVASIDWDVTFDKIKRACLLIRRGALFVATNLDPTRPTEEGLVPGTGALIAAIATGAEVQPIAIGKPEPTMFEQAMAEMGATPATTATLGDRIDTDMEGGRRAGLTTIMVLSGSTLRPEAEAYGCEHIFEDITDLLSTWQTARTAPPADPTPHPLGGSGPREEPAFQGVTDARTPL